MKLTRNRLVAGLVVAAGMIVSVVAGTAINAAVIPGVFHGYDCSGNSIVACGFSSVSKLRSSYNSSSELKALYGHFGWTSSDINGTNGVKMVAGVVYRNGTVVVNGKTIATNAGSVGRWQDDGTGCKATQSFTIGSHKYWQSTPNCRYGYEGEDAWVMINAQGQFVGAINKACGNPAPAHNVVPSPVYTCDKLTATPIKLTDGSILTYKFAATSTAKNGATLKNYSYNFGDGTSITTGASTSHTYAKDGTHAVTVTANFSVDGAAKSATSSSCKVSVTTKKVVPPAPVYTCDLLTIDKISDTQYKFSTKYTVKNATLKSVNYVVTNASGKQISSSTNTSYTQTTPGTYSVQAYVTATVNGSDKTVTSAACTGKITVPAPVTHPGVTITKTVDNVKSKQEQIGKNYEYEVTVKNTGDVTLTNVAVNDNAPAGVTLLSADQGTVANNAWSYTIPTLNVGQSMTFKITAVVKDYTAGAMVNKACVDAPQVPGSPDACDTATVTVPCPPVVTHPSISIVKTVDSQKDEEVQLNTNYEYEVTVKNTGDVALTNAKVTDPAPAGVTLISADQGVVANNAWSYTIPTLNVGQSMTFKITAVVSTYFEGVATNKACVSTPQITTPSEECDTATVHVPTPPTPPVQIVVCDLSTMATVTINESDFDSSKYSRTLSDCQPVTPVTPPAPVAPVVATVMPTTGTSGVIASLLGIGSITGATWYYIASRRG